jgi:hypothetical protein
MQHWQPIKTMADSETSAACADAGDDYEKGSKSAELDTV